MIGKVIETVFIRFANLARAFVVVLAASGGIWLASWSIPDAAAQHVAFVTPLAASSLGGDAGPQPAASRFDTVLAVQRLLYANGFAIDEIDGLLDTYTSDAIRSFQRQNNLKVDGQISESLITFLALHAVDLMEDGDRAAIIEASVNADNDGEEDEEGFDVNARSNVAFVQRLLTRTGFDPGRIDGIFVAATEQAIRDYQRRSDLEVTDEITPELITSLDEFEESIRGS